MTSLSASTPMPNSRGRARRDAARTPPSAAFQCFTKIRDHGVVVTTSGCHPLRTRVPRTHSSHTAAPIAKRMTVQTNRIAPGEVRTPSYRRPRVPAYELPRTTAPIIRLILAKAKHQPPPRIASTKSERHHAQEECDEQRQPRPGKACARLLTVRVVKSIPRTKNILTHPYTAAAPGRRLHANVATALPHYPRRDAQVGTALVQHAGGRLPPGRRARSRPSPAVRKTPRGCTRRPPAWGSSSAISYQVLMVRIAPGAIPHLVITQAD